MDFMISFFGSDPAEQIRYRRNMRVSRDADSTLVDLEWTSKGNLMDDLPPEDDSGNIEYKLKLVDPNPSRFEHLVTQMKWRLREGQGEAIYEIGVEDNGLLAGLTESEMSCSLSTLKRMADRLGASVTILRERDVEDEQGNASDRRVAEVLVRRLPETQEFIDLRIAVLGCADAGKSTLLGVLTQGELDNGRGRARLNLFRHLHEIQSGRTSSISLDILGFGPEGETITHLNHAIDEILDKSSKLVTFIDLGYKPHFAMLVVAANMGVVGTTKEHLALAMALEVPIFVVVTKIDLVSPATLSRTLSQLESFLKSPVCKRIPLRIETDDDALSTAANFTMNKVVPIFVLSSVSGDNIELLLKFFNVLPCNVQDYTCDSAVMQERFEFEIDEVFNVYGVGVVAAGMVSKGIIREGDDVLVGPSPTGEFYPAVVESLHRNKVACQVVHAGQAASVALGNFRDVNLRKGMVLVSSSLLPKAAMQFEAKVYVLHHPSAYICQGFQATVHAGNVCQTATIVHIDKSCLRPNENATTVRFKFLKNPEYLTVGSRLLFREGKTKGIGHVTKVLHDEEN